MSTQYTSTPPLSPSTLLPYPHTLPQLEKPYTGEYGAAMTDLQIGDLYINVISPLHPLYILEQTDDEEWAVRIRNVRTQHVQYIPYRQFRRWWRPLGENQ